jgi:hypothetical protein
MSFAQSLRRSQGPKISHSTVNQITHIQPEINQSEVQALGFRDKWARDWRRAKMSRRRVLWFGGVAVFLGAVTLLLPLLFYS